MGLIHAGEEDPAGVFLNWDEQDWRKSERTAGDTRDMRATCEGNKGFLGRRCCTDERLLRLAIGKLGEGEGISKSKSIMQPAC